MGIFEKNNPLETEIEKATSEKNTTEKWGVIMEICDNIGSSSVKAKESLKIIVRRLNHSDPHVVAQAITLLDACVNNCGKNFHLEIASRDFESEFKKLLAKNMNEKVIIGKFKQSLKKWAEGDFKSDPQLALIPSLYKKLKSEGHDFSDVQVTPKREVVLSKDPNVVSSQQEEDDIAKAIELSLKVKENSPKSSTFNSPSLYPNVNVTASSGTVSNLPTTTTAAPEPRKVRALYDFEAAEDNELTFKAGEILMVLEDTDPNWWRGQNHRGEGFFPANFVTADLSAEPEDLMKESKAKAEYNKKAEQLKEAFEEKQKNDQIPIEINEDSIDRLLFLLHEADPSDSSQDSEEMLRLEHVVNQMGPLIDSELERVDRKHAQLTQLSSDLIDTINLYHSLMRETERAPAGVSGFMPSPYQGTGNSMYGAPTGNVYGNNMYRLPGSGIHPNMLPPGMMVPPQSQIGYPPNSMAYQMPRQPIQGNPQQMQSMPQQQSPMTNGPSLPHNQSQQQAPPHQMNSQQQTMIPNNSQPMNMPSQQLGHMNMIGQSTSQQSTIPNYGQNMSTQQQQTQAPSNQVNVSDNSMNQGNYNINSVPNIHPQQQQSHTSIPNQLNHMMNNMNLQSASNTMNNMQMPPTANMQITQPITYLQQQESNQNIPIYQQR